MREARADARHAEPSPERVAIIGAGALGLALATALHASGVALHLILRPGGGRNPQLACGFSRSGLFGDVSVPPDAFSLHDSVDVLPAIDPDFTLVCTKTPSTPGLAPPLGRALAAAPRPSPVVVCHNGWGSAEQFAAHLDPRRVFSARVITGFRLTDPARVDVGVHAAPIHLGSLFGADTSVLAPLARAIDGGGLPCAVSDDVRADLLAKLLYNGLLNPLGALVRAPYGALGERTETRALLEALAYEIFSVFDAAGLRTHWPAPADYLRSFFADLLPPTASHESSMLQDLRAGRVTEVDAISGAICALGRAHGVETPLNAALLTLVHVAEARARG